jgi:hypothetical protein
MTVTLSLIQPAVTIALADADPQVLAAVDADTLNGTTPDTTGLALLATATAGAARTVLGIDSDDAVTFGAITGSSLKLDGGINVAGNVGIGITGAPTRALDVYGSAQFKDASGIGTTIWSEAVTGAGGMGTNTNHPFVVLTNGVGRLRISATGELILGTDPGGSELVRVGGSMKLGGVISSLSGGEIANYIAINRIGSDAIGDGPYLYLGESGSPTLRQILQLSSAGHLDFWAYGSSAWNRRMRLENGGALTISGKLSANSAAASSTLTGNTVAQVISWLQTVFA